MYRRCVILVAVLLLLPLLSGLSGCVYYNTFYNAKKEFKQAEKYRKQTGSGSQSGYKTAIDKSLKVLDDHPNSKYYDDALFVLAVSYYYTKQPVKSERRLRELLANYPDSKFAKEATLYLARAKLQIDERDAATDLFEEIFQGKFDKQYKAEAAMELGSHFLETKEFDLALSYFKAVRDSLGDDKQKLLTQRYIADAEYGAFKFADALSSYLQILGMKPDKNDKYHALYQAALCSYRLQRISTGLDYLQQLTKDQLYFDSLGILTLTVAQGYEYAEELDQAIGAYSDVANNSKNPQWISEAYYQMALIYQYDYDDLKQAKEYYDKSFSSFSGGQSAQDAMQRSADLAKLQSYTQKEQGADTLAAFKDTTLTEDKRQEIRQRQIDNDASILYQLAELYWFKLNKPDSAIAEMGNLIERFPNSKHAAHAMLALSAMRRDFYSDTAGADSILHEAVRRYPQSDDLPEILAQLNLKGTEADTGYAAYYYHKAENFFVDEKNLDSAIYYYQYVSDHFPKSPLALQSRFNIIWLKETYLSPGDSSIVYAYQELVDSFPNTPQATEATRRLTYHPIAPPPQRHDSDDVHAKERADTSNAAPGEPVTARPAQQDSTQYGGDPRARAYIGPKGEQLILLEAQPTETRVEFEFPAEANSIEGTAWEMYYQILLDFSGKVVDYVLKTPGPHEEINRRAGLTIASMSFDPLEVNRQLTQKAESLTLPENQEDKRGRWFVYKFLVQKPDYLR